MRPDAYTFTSQEYDRETQLYYFGGRYLDSRSALWVSADPILGSYLGGSPNRGVFNPHNLDLYSYSYNSPLWLKDPDGRHVFLLNHEAPLRQMLFEAIGALTDDSLHVSAGAHEITTITRVNGGTHPLGTLLVRLLIDSEHDIGIMSAGRTSFTAAINEGDAAPVGTTAPGGAGVPLPGTGRGSNATVIMGSDATAPMATRDSDGVVRNHPASFVGSLAHELIHALDIIFGQHDPTRVNHTYDTRPGVSRTETQRRRELRATGVPEDVSITPSGTVQHGNITQNSIAQEQDTPIRAAYETVPGPLSTDPASH